MIRLSTFVIAALVFGASTAQAATVVVKQGTVLPTIQSGVDASTPGDTVLVFPGVYHESVLVPSGKPVKLKAKGAVIVDGRGPGGSALGPGILVFESSCSITGFRFRNQADVGPGTPGVGIDYQPAGLPAPFVVEKCTFEHCRNGGVRGFGNGIVVRQCTFRDIDAGLAIDVDGGFNLLVEKCQLIGTQGIWFAGNEGTFRGNVLKNCTSSVALGCNGDETLVEKNVIVGCEGRAIDVSGVHVVVRKNLVENCGDEGIVVHDGAGVDANNVVESNTVVAARVAGIRTSGVGTTVRKNVVRRTRIGEPVPGLTFGPGTSAGIDCSGPGHVVESNVIEDSSGYGISSLGAAGTFVKNRVTRCGTGADAGLYIEGIGFDYTEISGNVVAQQRGDGVVVGAASATIRTNRATSCTRDGFDIISNQSMLVEGNVAIGNGAEGFDLDGPNMQFRKNVAKGNRIDIAASFLLSLFELNSFGTGGPATLPEVD